MKNPISINSRWVPAGSLLALAATFLYFGSDDWHATTRQLGLVLAWICYSAGLLVWLRYLTRLSGWRIPTVMGVLLGMGGLVAVRSQLMSDRWVYLWTHPYAFLLNLIRPPFLLDARALHNWMDFTLAPYLLLFELSISLLLIVVAVRGILQLLHRSGS